MIVTVRQKRGVLISTNSQFAIAIHILALLAQEDDGLVTSERMAGSVNTNPVFLRRVLGLLSRAGLVISQPGAGGGWRLRRDPASITLLEVYHAVDGGHVLAMHHSQPNPDCLIGRNIQQTLTIYFDEAQQAFEQALARQTIAQVLQTARTDPFPDLKSEGAGKRPWGTQKADLHAQ